MLTLPFPNTRKEIMKSCYPISLKKQGKRWKIGNLAYFILKITTFRNFRSHVTFTVFLNFSKIFTKNPERKYSRFQIFPKPSGYFITTSPPPSRKANNRLEIIKEHDYTSFTHTFTQTRMKLVKNKKKTNSRKHTFACSTTKNFYSSKTSP